MASGGGWGRGRDTQPRISLDNRRLHCFQQAFSDDQLIPVQAWDSVELCGVSRFEAKHTNRKGGHVISIRSVSEILDETVEVSGLVLEALKGRKDQIQQESGAKLILGDGNVWLRGGRFEIQEAVRKISSCIAECDAASEMASTSPGHTESTSSSAGQGSKGKGKQARKKGKSGGTNSNWKSKDSWWSAWHDSDWH